MENCDTPTTKHKASCDPGWNDPPTFTYNSQQTPPNKPRNFLNKRVAFPLQGLHTNTVTQPVNLPPLPNVTLPGGPVIQKLSTNVNSQETLEIDSERTLLEVKAILIKLLESSDLGTKADGIKKRISTMEDMWTNGKLSKIVQIQMNNLAHALQDDKPLQADNIHKSMMVDHVSEVCTWMPGIKQLIYHCVARSELLAIEQE